MRTWLKRIRGAVLMGLTWAVVWVPVALLTSMIVDPDGSMDEPWIAVGTFPGFLAGVMFSVVLGIAAKRRRLDELSVRKVGGWGAVAGVLIGSLPFALGDSDGRTGNLWLLPVVVISSITVLSAVSAAGSFALARRADKREMIDAAAPAALGGSDE